ncbi:preprotein translocase subunit YajC [Cellulosilyticum ruminicola]|uniref:preprotein translocase subunit YajC n=1 Tax=Cellulosilyticum ruminicola TaxID=425254 RepID=UPI0006D0616A|nr:preprotein translocase subunit YajC [Cellulosilyticum ruminicola]
MNTVLLTTAGGGIMSIGVTVAYMAVFFGVMWFLIIRPQRKREKEVATMQDSIKVGQHVLLNSGMYGKVVDIVNDVFIIEFGLNKGVRIPVKKIAIAAVQEPNLTVGKKAEEVEYEYVEVEVDENGNEIKK